MSEGPTERLRLRAEAVRARAHAPYSGYAVGAAILDDRGRIYEGCNVENASYGLSLCAERAAVAAAVADGATRFVALVVVTAGAAPGTPCGACRQVLREFPPSFEVHCVTTEGVALDTTVDRLLPDAFGPSHLG